MRKLGYNAFFHVNLSVYMQALMLLSTCPHEVATEIARQIVHRKLAACINIIPSVQSIYRWQDAVEETKEALLIIKTTHDCYEILEKEILKLHPYENPEILALPITQGSNAYLQWLLTSCLLVEKNT